MAHIGDLIDVLKEDEQTVDYVKSKIKILEEREGNTKNCTGYTNAFHSTSNWRNNNNYRSPQRGGRGGARGRSCPIPRGNGRGSWRGSPHHTYQRGRGRENWHQQQQQREEKGFGASGTNDNSRSDGSAYITQVEYKSNENVCVIERNNCTREIEWVLDSGCSDHIINNINYYYNYIDLKDLVDVKVGDGRILKATKIGVFVHYFTVYNELKLNTMRNVFFVEKMDKSLISFSKVTMMNKIVSIDNISKIYSKSNNELNGIAFKTNNIYKMYSIIKSQEVHMSEQMTCNYTQKEKYHKLLGHVNFNYLDILCTNKLVNGMPNELENEYLKCGTCVQNKTHNIKFENNRHKSKEMLVLSMMSVRLRKYIL